MTPKRIFRAAIEDAGDGGAYVTVPFDVEQVFGKKRVKVAATIDGAPYRGSLVRMGSEQHILIVRKDIREMIGKAIGDTVEVAVEEDDAPRVVQVPADLSAALEGDAEASAAFGRLSYSHQKEYVQWIEEAKRAETRQRRIAQAMQRLKEGKNAA